MPAAHAQPRRHVSGFDRSVASSWHTVPEPIPVEDGKRRSGAGARPAGAGLRPRRLPLSSEHREGAPDLLALRSPGRPAGLRPSGRQEGEARRRHDHDARAVPSLRRRPLARSASGCGHPRAPRHPQARVGAPVLAGRLLRPLHVLPLPDGVPRQLRGEGRRRRPPPAAGRGLPPGRSVRRRDDAALDAHGLPRPPLERRPARGSRSSSAASSAAGSARSARSTTSSPGSSRRRSGRGGASRRGEQDAHLPAREVLPPLRVPRRRRRRERHRRDVRPDLHRGPVDRPRGHPGACST